MNEIQQKRSTVQYIFACLAGFFIAVVLATIFTAMIVAVADYFLYPKPPSANTGWWSKKFIERVNWTFVTILWSVTFFAALISLFGDALKRWGKRKLNGVDREF